MADGDVAAAGDLGYTRGTGTVTFTGETARCTSESNYLVIRRKQADGSWQIAVDGCGADPGASGGTR